MALYKKIPPFECVKRISKSGIFFAVGAAPENQRSGELLIFPLKG